MASFLPLLPAQEGGEPSGRPQASEPDKRGLPGTRLGTNRNVRELDYAN